MTEISDQSPISDAGWPCPPPRSPSSTWPEFPSRPVSKHHPLTASEQARVASDLVQEKAMRAMEEYFNPESNDSEEEEQQHPEEEDDAGNYSTDEDEEEPDYLGLFTKVFAEDSDLKEYYERNFRNGEFRCLVCGGVKKKVWRRFRNCAALVHHSTNVAKTTRRIAHRAYGEAICKLLGWDTDAKLVEAMKSLTVDDADKGQDNIGKDIA